MMLRGALRPDNIRRPREAAGVKPLRSSPKGAEPRAAGPFAGEHGERG
jgi:hypothetical protein